jgi:predicted component of viral defense system (DUF524 family)
LRSGWPEPQNALMTATTDAPDVPHLRRIRHRDDDATKHHAVPEPLRRFLAPAESVIYEWTPYVVEWPGATRLRTGSAWHRPIAPGVFQLSFDNQLGLTTIRAYDESAPLGEPMHLEVIAGKFTSPERSVAFLRQTVTDLFARLASSPFVLGAATERMVRESQAPPNALFAYHFFRHHGNTLIRSLQAVQGRPHQRLTAEPELVRPHEVRQVDRESMVRMLRAGHPSPIALSGNPDRLTPLQRLRPERVWQQIPAETFDTPENRFVLAVCRRLLSTIQGLRRAAWCQPPNIPTETLHQFDNVAEHLSMLTMDHRLAPLGPMVVTPSQSRVLQRRDGYRELAMLWQLFQRSRQPLFERMQHAIDLRNIAELYEIWVWFELIDRIKAITGSDPVPLPVPTEFGIPGWKSRVRFGGHGTLHYNKPEPGYSGIGLRPDYVWERLDGTRIVMDAKFRMQRPTTLLDETTGEITVFDDQRAKDDDLQKMHAYRDALRDVEAAIVLYPGNVTAFRDTTGVRLDLGIAEVLTGVIEGIGAIPMSPIATPLSEE